MPLAVRRVIMPRRAALCGLLLCLIAGFRLPQRASVAKEPADDPAQAAAQDPGQGAADDAVQVAADDPLGCQKPLDEDTVNQLLLYPSRPSARPGDTVLVTLGYWECCVFLHRVPACAEWSLEPSDAASLEELPLEADPYTPSVKLTLDPLVPHGEVITLRADVESGRRILEAEVHVYTPEQNPLVGFWHERLQETCPQLVRGDVDQANGLNITDAIAILGHLFLGAEAPGCLESADSNGDGKVDISDGVYILSFLFTGGAAPAAPFPDCGAVILTSLGCEDFHACAERFVAPEKPIEELLLEADGTFSVTWTPFEIYRDYWGDYTYDLATRAIDLKITGGNNMPGDMRCLPGSRFEVEAGGLRLKNVWLGSPGPEQTAFRCGHVFER